MRVLHLTNKPIYPLLDGGCLAMNQIAKLLEANKFELKNLTFETEKHPFSLDSFPIDFRSDFAPEAVLINAKVSIFGALKSILKNESYNLARFKSHQFASRLKELLLQKEYDFVICESIYMLVYLDVIRKVSKAKIIVRTHNVEYNLWERLASHARFPKSTYLNYLSKKLKSEEIPLLQKCDAIMNISEQDEKIFKSLSVVTKMITIPVFIDEPTQKSDYSSSKFHHIGTMNWQPNIEAVEELLTTIFPKIKSKIPDAELHLAGSFFPQNLISNPEKGIFVHGFVADKFDFISKHGIQLIPLKSGSGVRIKILESMSIGAPIVTTAIGAEGIEITNSKELFIAENNEDFIKKALKLNKNDDLRQEMGRNAQKLIREKYNFEKVNKQFIEFFKTIS